MGSEARIAGVQSLHGSPGPLPGRHVGVRDESGAEWGGCPAYRCQTMTGTASAWLVAQLVTMGLSALAVSGGLSSAGPGSSLVAMTAFSISLPALLLVVLGLIPV